MTDTPKTSTVPPRGPHASDYRTLLEALDTVDSGGAGMNFHGPRGDLVETLAYAGLPEVGRDVGARLLALGLKPGDRVGVLAETHGDFVRAFIGALYAGLVPCPIPLPPAFGDHKSYGQTVLGIVGVAGFSVLLMPEDYLELVTPSLEGVSFDYIGPLDGLPPAKAPVSAAPGPDDLAYLQFSSGTTGAPKGVAVTHGALMANLGGMQSVLEISGDDRGVSWLPFYHDMGMVGCVLLPLAVQFPIDYLATRDFIRRPGLWLSMISKGSATMSYAPSFGYELAARRAKAIDGLKLDTWRIAGIGGDMIRSGSLADFNTAYAPFGFDAASFTPSYGMAEVTLGLTFPARRSGLRTHRIASEALASGLARPATEADTWTRDYAICGKALPGHEISVRLEDGREAGLRQIGQIFARGPSVMRGYFQDEAATAGILDPQGWLDTGDIGFLDEAGELTLTGRAKDLIIVNGRNIWPQDVEWTMEQRIDGVRDGSVAAFSTEALDGNAEEQLTMVIEHRSAQNGTAETLIAEVDRLVRSIYQLTPVVALARPGTLPRTSSGKLSRSKAREMFLSREFAR
ncbi:MAG: fatty acyl-AMP ligase [Pseudomonadota bacterium]